MAGNKPTKLRMAVFGLGRMGLRHARNVAKSPRVELAMVCDPREEVTAAALRELPPTTRGTTDAEDVFTSADVDAVLIASETATHAPLALRAMAAGKHVLIEKPISVDIANTLPVVEAAKQHPELTVMIGFSRRFDESYQEAKARIERGELGKPYLLKGTGNDKHDPSGFFVAYSKASGGIFLDCGIHEIDLARWLLDTANPAHLKNPHKEVTRVYATGFSVQHPELAALGDCDNGLGMVDFENGTATSIHVSRTATHGHDVVTEVFGTEGKFVVNGSAALNRLEIRDVHGVRTQSTPTYYERFREAFQREVDTFADCVLDAKPAPTTCDDALQAAQICIALTHSFRTGKPVYFDDEGKPILA